MASAQEPRLKTGKISNPSPDPQDEADESKPYSGPDSTGASLLALLETLPRWAGDDLDALLAEVHATRGRFYPDAVEEIMATTSKPTYRSQATGAEDATDRTIEGEESKPYSGPDATIASFREHLKHVPKWSGDDLHERLDEVIQSRSQIEF